MENKIRETREVETPISKQKIVLNKWITEGESRKISLAEVSSEGIKMKVKPEEKKEAVPEMEITGEQAILLLHNGQNAKITAAVVSIDDSKEGIVERLLGFNKKDFRFVAKEIDKVVKNEDFLG